MASVYKIPDFAVLCSFFERYGEQLQLPDLTIPELQIALEHEHTVVPELKEIFFKLLKRIVKSINREKWERKLVQLTREHYSEMAAWEIERLGFVKCRLNTKVEVLKYLCESQFDDNVKFKEKVNSEDPEQMRVKPIGRDKMGLVYWLQRDQDTNLRVYREEQDDEDSSTWEMISTQRDELANLIDTLKKGSNHLKGEDTPDDSESTSDSISAIEKAVKAQLGENGDSKEGSIVTGDEQSQDTIKDEEETSKAKDDSQDDEDASKKSGENGDNQDIVAEDKEGEDKLDNTNSGKGKDRGQDGDDKKSNDETVESQSEAKDGGSVIQKGRRKGTYKTEGKDETETVREKETGSEEKCQKHDKAEDGQESNATVTESAIKERQGDDVEKQDDALQNKDTQVEKERKDEQGTHFVEGESKISTEINSKKDKSSDAKDAPGKDGSAGSTDVHAADKMTSIENTQGNLVKDNDGSIKNKTVVSTDNVQGKATKDDKTCPEDSATKQKAQPLISSFQRDAGTKEQTDSENVLPSGINQNKEVREVKTSEAVTEKSEAKSTDANSNETGKTTKGSDEGMDSIKKDDNKIQDTTRKIGGEESDGAKISQSDAEKQDAKSQVDKERMETKATLESADDFGNRTESVIKHTGKMKKNTEKRVDTITESNESTSKDTCVIKKIDGDDAGTSESKKMTKDMVKDSGDANNKEVVQDVKVKDEKVHKDKMEDICNVKKEVIQDVEDEKVGKAKAKDIDDVKKEVFQAVDMTSKDVVKQEEVAGQSKEGKQVLADEDVPDEKSHVKRNKEEGVIVKSGVKDDARKSRDGKDADPGDQGSESKSADTDDKAEVKVKKTLKKDDNNLKETKSVKTEPLEVKKDNSSEGGKQCSKSEDKTDGEVTENSKHGDKDSNGTCKTEENIKTEIKSEEIVSESENSKSKEGVEDSKMVKEQNGEVVKDEKDVKKMEIKKEKQETEHVKDEKFEKETNDSKKDVKEIADKTEGVKQEKEKTNSKNQENKRKINEIESDTSESSSKKVKGKDGTDAKEDAAAKEDATGESGKDGANAKEDAGEAEEKEKDESDEEESNQKKTGKKNKKGKTQKAPVRVMPRRSTRAKIPAEEDEEKKVDDEEESEDEVKSSKKKPQTKKGRPKKRKSEDEEKDDDNESEDEVKSSKKGRQTKKGRPKKDSSEDSEEKEDSEEEDEEESEEEEASTKKAKAPAKKGKKKRGRPKRKASSKASAKLEEICIEEEEEEEFENDQPCCKCGLFNHPEWILLCDKCDSGYHTACLRPPLMVIPDGNWYCPTCEHAELIVKLEAALEVIDGELRKKHVKEKRKKRSTRWAYTDLCMDNILPEEEVMVRKNKDKHRSRSHRHSRHHSRSPSRSHRPHARSSRRSERRRRHQEIEDLGEFEDYEVVTKRSTRQRKEISYKFEDFDEAINSAIHEEVEEHKKAVEQAKNTFGISRGKDMSNILGAVPEEEEEEEDEDDKRAKKGRRRLNDLDATSEEDSDDFKVEGSEAESEEAEEEPSEDSDASGDSGVVRPRRRSKRSQKWAHLPRRKSERSRQRGRRTRYNEDSESSLSFEAEEEFGSDASSAYSDEYGATRRAALRRPISYREKSDSETEDEEKNPDYEEEPKKTKKDYETSTDEDAEETYSRKRKFVLQSDEEDEGDGGEEEEEEEEKTRTVAKKAKKQDKKRKRHEDDSDFSPSQEKEDKAEFNRKKRSRKRVDYKKMAEGDSDSKSENEEEEEEMEEEKSDEEEKSASKQNHKTAKEDTTKGSVAKESVRGKISDSERTSKVGASGTTHGTQSPTSASLNGGETLFNGDDDEDDEDEIGDAGSGAGESVGADVDDVDLLNVTDLVEFVTQDS